MTNTALDALRRWEDSGATWTVRTVAGGVAEVDLVSCDGGQVMGHLASSDPEFVDYVNSGPSGGG